MTMDIKKYEMLAQVIENDMTDTIHLKIKICVNPYHLCYLWFPR